MITNYYRNIRDPKLTILEKFRTGSWLHVTDPSQEELNKLVKDFGFDEDLLDDGVDLYESPRLEHEDKNIYIYTRYCFPDGQYTSTEPLLLIITPNCLVTVARRSPEPINDLIQKVDTITTQKIKLVLLILESVNEGYRRHLNDVTRQILSSRKRLQKTIVNNDDVLKFIDIEEDLNEFLAALQPTEYCCMHYLTEDISSSMKKMKI